ncbi:hypothetical protein RBXJA2T_08820 [Rubrivivax benzoatilyticus JA2 = ATCC BAA-35]|nr:hypothetical protein RBXJA2T_08820 [Rubrivivax benzoatilyticus JA2 = ATCC BAA-35]
MPSENSRPVTRVANCCSCECSVSCARAVGSDCTMPARGFSSISRTMSTSVRPLIVLSASSTTM